MRGVTTRACAVMALAAIETGTTLDVALEAARKQLAKRLKRTAQSSNVPSERAFLQALLLICLRHYGQINGIVTAHVRKQPNGRARQVMTLLRLSVAEIFLMETPDYASVSVAVALVRHLGLSGHAGLVNGALRTIIRARTDMEQRLDNDRLEALRTNTPAWLWSRWEANFGNAETRALANAHLHQPRLDITVACKSKMATYADALGGVPVSECTIRMADGAGGAVAGLAGYDAGDWWVQDMASTLPVRLLGDVRGRRVLDMCAAPGGKCAQLLVAGATVTAIEKQPPRMRVLRENMTRLGLQPTYHAGDALNFQTETPFDIILLDAPCSATGTMRRHPDIALHRRMKDITSLAALQRRLLKKAERLIAPGGVILYCTCSLEPEEGLAQIEDFLTQSAVMDSLPIESVEATQLGIPAECITQGCVQTLPHRSPVAGGWDGFFIARLHRRP